MFMAWLCSKNRHNINWHVVLWGVGLQFLFALFIFCSPVGGSLFNWINGAVVKLLSFSQAGTSFVFGPLAVGPGSEGPMGEKSIGFILAFQALPAAVFFSALMSLLYHVGIMQKIIKGFSYIFTQLMRISGAEALGAASNMVVGVEAVFTIRPYLERMTSSELCLILTAGMATIASTVMAIYVGFLKTQFPSIAGHLVSASLLSAPAAIVMSKLLYPEDEKPLTLGQVVAGHYHRSSSWVEAVIKGSNEGVKLVVGIVALLLSFLGLLAMVNWIMSGLTQMTLQQILAFVFYPFSFLMGVPLKDVAIISALLGERAVATELVAYQHLATFISTGAIVNTRSIVIASYALCGFAHIASLAIFMGGIAAIAPERAKDLAKLGFRALLGATLACLMTGAVAGIFN